jgi:hypothetical protein
MQVFVNRQLAFTVFDVSKVERRISPCMTRQMICCYDGMARGTLGRCSCSWVGAQLAALLAIGFQA